MSVLKSRRHESKAEFVNVADDIYVETMGFIFKLSNRCQRFLGEDTMHLASKVLDNAEMAQNVRITDNETFKQRRKYLIEARAALMALDVHMTHIWRALMKNPEGCFTTASGRTKTPQESVSILNKMAESLGEKIDKEKALLTGVLESDKKTQGKA